MTGERGVPCILVIGEAALYSSRLDRGFKHLERSLALPGDVLLRNDPNGPQHAFGRSVGLFQNGFGAEVSDF